MKVLSVFFTIITFSNTRRIGFSDNSLNAQGIDMIISDWFGPDVINKPEMEFEKFIPKISIPSLNSEIALSGTVPVQNLTSTSTSIKTATGEDKSTEYYWKFALENQRKDVTSFANDEFETQYKKDDDVATVEIDPEIENVIKGYKRATRKETKSQKNQKKPTGAKYTTMSTNNNPITTTTSRSIRSTTQNYITQPIQPALVKKNETVQGARRNAIKSTKSPFTKTNTTKGNPTHHPATNRNVTDDASKVTTPNHSEKPITNNSTKENYSKMSEKNKTSKDTGKSPKNQGAFKTMTKDFKNVFKFPWGVGEVIGVVLGGLCSFVGFFVFCCKCCVPICRCRKTHGDPRGQLPQP